MVLLLLDPYLFYTAVTLSVGFSFTLSASPSFFLTGFSLFRTLLPCGFPLSLPLSAFQSAELSETETSVWLETGIESKFQFKTDSYLSDLPESYVSELIGLYC